MEKKIEKRKFFISDFQEEAAWLTYMHREGWKFIKTTGYQYEFERCEGEDWVYQLDFKENGIAEGDYIRMFQDYGWEYIGQFHKWFYFRKLKTEKDVEDLSIFSDNESKIDMCKRVINGSVFTWIPLILIILVYDYLMCFTTVFRGKGFLSNVTLVIAIIAILIVVFALSIFVGQYSRLNNMIKKLEHPITTNNKL